MDQENTVATKPANVPAPKRGAVASFIRFVVIMSLVLLVPIVAYGTFTNTLYYDVTPQQTVVVRYPSGHVLFFKNSGPVPVILGEATPWVSTWTYYFSASPDQGKSKDQSLPIMFSDKTPAHISGSVMLTLPAKDEQLALLYKDGYTMKGIIERVYRPIIEHCVYTAGSAISSQEAASEKRGLLGTLIKDQLEYGVYELANVPAQGKDGKQELVATRQKSGVQDDHGYKRQGPSGFEKYGIVVSMFNLSNIKFEPDVVARFAKQQEKAQLEEISIVQGRLAKQENLTAAEEGKKAVTVAEYSAKVSAKKEEIEAERDKNVAKTKADQLLYVADKKLEASISNMKADQNEAVGAKAKFDATHGFKEILDARVEVAKALAPEIGKQSWVPRNVVGSSNGNNQSNGMSNLSQALTQATELANGLVGANWEAISAKVEDLGSNAPSKPTTK